MLDLVRYAPDVDYRAGERGGFGIIRLFAFASQWGIGTPRACPCVNDAVAVLAAQVIDLQDIRN